MSKKFLILGAFALSACGGGGDNTVGATFVAPTGPAAMLDRIDEANTLLTALTGTDAPFSEREGSTTAPSFDSATFEGVFIVTRDANAPGDTYYGDTALTVDFAGGSLVGTADDFYYYDTSGSNGRTGQSVAGSLLLQDEAGIAYDIPATAPRESFDLTVNGSLSMAGRLRSVTDSNIDAAFASPNDGDLLAGSDNDVDMVVGDGTISFAGQGSFDAFFLTCIPGTADC